jgi:hypothetical protein
MKLKTSDLEGVALDWAVAQARIDGAFEHYATPGWSPSTVWSQGGPIIEREGITIEYEADPQKWCACIMADQEVYGPTALIAAMRCYVASTLGETVEVPDDIALDSMIYNTCNDE